MKIKKKSIIIPAFALLIGASLAGSITGTVAWYQYSTRVNAAYVGVSGGTSGNLQMRLRDGNYNAQTGDWITRLSVSDIQTYLAGTTEKYGEAIQPITSGNMEKDGALPANFYASPLYGQAGAYAGNWQVANTKSYDVIPLQLRYVERDGDLEGGAKDDKNLAKKVFLTDLLIQGDKANTADPLDVKKDLSDAIRFHIDAYSDDDALVPANHINRLVSKKGGTTITNGQLDLDGDGALDYKYNSDKYGFGSDEKTQLVYGEGFQVAFSNETEVRSGTYYDYKGDPATDTNVYPMVVAPVSEGSLDLLDSNKEYDTGKSKSIGSTIAADDKYLNVDITIWVEGWQTFEDANTHKQNPIWGMDYIGSSFDVGFEFAVDTAE